MSLKLDIASAKSADNIAQSINTSGKYKGVITRAEKLKSEKGTHGVGLSFKSDTGATADYLDIYTENAMGEILPGNKVINALLVCMKLKDVPDGRIKCQKWNAAAGRKEEYEVDGYPALMGKSIGLLLQQEVGWNDRTNKETNKMVVFGVFEAGTEFTASEILDRKTTPERLSEMVDALVARPIRDNRKGNTQARRSPSHTAGPDDRGDPGFGDDADVPF